MRARRHPWRGRAAVAGALLALAACGAGEPASAPAAPQASAEPAIGEGPHDVAVLRVADLGVIRVELYPELAPRSVAHFTALANEGLYDGTTFHRVIPGFVVQGGDPFSKNQDPRDDGRGGWLRKVPIESSTLSHRRGVVSFAHSGGIHAGTQFFIVHQDATQLDGQYGAFGRVVEGMEVVDAITAVEIDTYGRYGPPKRPYPVNVVLESVRIEPAERAEAAEPAEELESAS